MLHVLQNNLKPDRLNQRDFINPRGNLHEDKHVLKTYNLITGLSLNYKLYSADHTHIYTSTFLNHSRTNSHPDRCIRGNSGSE